MFEDRDEILENYSCFLKTVKNDMEQSSKKLDAAEHARNKNLQHKNRKLNEETDISLYKDSYNMGIIVVSAAYETAGTILHVNDRAKIILKINEMTIGENPQLDDFIPSPFHKGHNKLMRDFIDFATSTSVFRPSLVVYNSRKFLVEVTYKFKAIAFNNVPMFVTGIRQKPKTTREVAIFTDYT
ncbi:MAG: hypothetical protein V2I33_25805 [Kangiellaceae bacterium]|jgi:hypothetical protein|nr:hypothetical protein [Kangiellaceae bacterium]